MNFDPETGRRVTPPPQPYSWTGFRRLPAGVQATAWVILGVLCLIVISVISHRGQAGGTDWLPSGAVKGRFAAPLPSQVTADHVYCQWVNGHVEVHVRFTNHDYGENTHTVQYYPHYEISGVSHGDSFGALTSHDIPAAKTVDVTDDAGTPSGTVNNAAITSCTPRQ